MLALCALLSARTAAGDRPAGYDAERPTSAPTEGKATTTLQSGPPSESATSSPAARRALERGLDWLAALAALACLAGGSQLERGPHGEALAGVIEWLLARVDLVEGSPKRGYVSDPGDALSRMHGHGFATLALAEAFAISPASPRGRRIELALLEAVDRIERSQHSTGGWGYEPIGGLLHEGSVTICVVQALRAARNSGIRVDPGVVGRAIDYVRKSQKSDGSFKYSLADERSSVALTAAAVSTLNAAGDYSSPAVSAGFDYLFRELAAREAGAGTPPDWPMYERLYLAQAFWQHEDEAVFARWYDRVLLELLREQNEDGSWASERYGSAYATAMACLVLALPEQLLPIFQR